MNTKSSQSDYIFHILFAIIVLLFVGYKIQYLNTPYFWDELVVYGRGVAYQYHHAVSMMPSSIDPDISRGHPLFFTVLYAGTQRIFGESVSVVHALTLLLSVTTMVVVYRKVSQYYDVQTGLICATILAIQPLFLAQSGLMLPEMLLSLFVLLSLTSYYEENYFQFALFASIAIMTKENAAVLPLAGGVYSLCRWIGSRQKPAGFKLGSIVLTLAPYVIFVIFMFVQKRQNGWYLFPGHTGRLDLNLIAMIRLFAGYLKLIVVDQQRYIISALMGIALILNFFVRKKSLREGLRGFVLPTIVFALFFIGFFSTYVSLVDRYVLGGLICFVIVGGISISIITSDKRIVALIVMGLIFIGWKNREETIHMGGDLNLGTFRWDADMGYVYRVQNVQMAVKFVDSICQPGEKAVGNFPAYFALSCPEAGYISKPRFTFGEFKPKTKLADYWIFSVMPSTDGGGQSDDDPDTSKYNFTLIRDLKEVNHTNNDVQVYRCTPKDTNVLWRGQDTIR